LLSVDVIKAIYERELARRGLEGTCDEATLQQIVKDLEGKIPPDIEIEYVLGEEIRNEDKVAND
jgi:hypothetical protein